jgi:nitroreductase
MSTSTVSELHRINEALNEAATRAGLAPSIHNTQPWRWKIRSGALELWSVPGRQLPVTDPDGRMVTISCGAALHHARLVLAARGYRSTVLTLPDPAHPHHLAQLTVAGHAPVTAETDRAYRAIAHRRTDRRPVADRRVSDAALLSITLAVQAEGMYLHVLRDDQVIELAGAAAYAQETEVRDESWRTELAYWAGGIRETRSGVPDTSIPAATPQTTVPARDFGHPGTLPAGPGHDAAARYAILYGESDDVPGWLQAGQALSAAWLTATDLCVSVVPMSGVIEVPATRQRLHGMLVPGCYPHLVLRLGTVEPGTTPPAPTPRLPAAQTVETIED